MTPTLDKALETLRSGNLPEGLRMLDALVEDAEVRPHALGHRAWNRMQVGRHEEALEDYDALLALTPGDHDAAALRARALVRLGRAEEAVRALAAVLLEDPAHALSADVLIEAQRALGVPRPDTLPASNVAPAPANPVLRRLEASFPSDPASVAPDAGRLLYALVRSLRPSLVVETGTFVGYSALCLAQGLEENGAGHLHCFDLFQFEIEYTSPVLGPCADALQAARGHLESAGLGHRVTFHKGDSAAQMPVALRGTESVDFAFIDGDHTARGAARDFLALQPFLRPGAVVVVHDTEPEQSRWMGPRWLLTELDRDPQAARGWRWVNLPCWGNVGMALLQKAGEGTAPLRMPTLTEALAERLWISSRWHQGRRR